MRLNLLQFFVEIGTQHGYGVGAARGVQILLFGDTDFGLIKKLCITI